MVWGRITVFSYEIKSFSFELHLSDIYIYFMNWNLTCNILLVKHLSDKQKTNKNK